MEMRLAKHFLRRLRYSQEQAAIDRAVETGLLVENGYVVDGFELRAFAPAPMSEKKPETEIARLLRRGAAMSAHQQSFDDDSGLGLHALLLDAAQGTETAIKSGKDAVGSTAVAGPVAAPKSQRPDLTGKLLRQLRHSAPPACAVDVATLLLLAQALTDSRVLLEDVLRVLSLRQPIVTICCAVKGFEDKFIELLRRGFVLPGPVAICSGFDLVHGGGLHFHPARNAKWRTILFAGRKFDADQLHKVGTQVGFAAQTPYPILGVAEDAEALPEQLRQAAQLTLGCGPLTMPVIHETMRVVLGKTAQGDIGSRSCSVLALSDLALAIRPGVSPARVLCLLEGLAEIRIRQAADESDSDSGRASGHKALSSSKSSRDPGSGSEVIQPVKLTADDKDRSVPFVPTVETLSGYGEATDWALALKGDLELWRQGRLGWEDMSVKLLLSGSPGTGKTLFARALCNSLQIPLIATSVATWLEPSHLGDVIKRMRTAFAEAEAMKPCILFVDELDGIGRRGRVRDYDDYWTSLVNCLLELLDGAAKSCGVIVVGATNNPGSIDPALLRSGRLEKHVAIPKPDTEALIGILRHHLRGDLEKVVASALVKTTTRISLGEEPKQLPEQQERAAADRTATPLPGNQPQDPASEPQPVGSAMGGRQ